jgi:hypothetical protein
MPERPVRGAVAVLVALLLVVLVAAAGLALDLGRLFVHKSELQNAVDACALAGARELNVQVKNLAIFTRAENAGITVAARNRADFQGGGVALAADRDVTFSTALDGSYVTKGAAPADARYVRCTTALTGLVPWFMRVMDASPRAVGATAVAWMGPGITTCALPMGMCRKAVPDPCTVPGVSPDANGLCKGQWYSGRFDAGGGATGSFNWLDYVPHAGGASTIKAGIEGAGFCDVKLGDQVHAEVGMNESVATAWNSRFGLYKQGGGNPQPSDAAPDFSGYAYTSANWPTGHDAYADFAQRQAAYTSYGPPSDTTARGNTITGLSISNAFKTSTSGATGIHGTKGADRRVMTMPVVDCASWGSGHVTATQGWACVLMLTPIDSPTQMVVLEYLGVPGNPGVPCGSYGQGGSASNGPPVPTLVQ